jgi:Tfp pilus assembly protein PilN
MAKVDPLPQLSFHKETQMLIAVGPEAIVDQIPDVLGALRLDRGPAVDRIMKLQAELAEVLANPGGGNEKKAAALQKEISEIAARQKANEIIDQGGRRLLPPPPVTPN